MGEIRLWGLGLLAAVACAASCRPAERELVTGGEQRRAILPPVRPRALLQSSSPLSAVVALATGRGIVCSGAVVHPSFVLTAQHCLPSAEVRVQALDGRTLERARVIAFWVPNPRLDLALVRVAEPLGVTPLKVGWSSAVVPERVLVAGYGSGDPRALESSGVLHAWPVTLRGWGCDESRAQRIGCSPGSELVIGREAGRDTCRGDSGGPVLAETDRGLSVVAVTSRSVQGALLSCGDGGVYVRTDGIARSVERYLRRSARSLEARR